MERIVFDPAESVAAGAVGKPGQRRFLIQAASGDAVLSVLVEKEQVAMLCARVLQLLTELESVVSVEDDEGTAELPSLAADVEPLFRARMMRLGYDTEKEMVMLELFEDNPPEGLGEDEEEADQGDLEELGFEPEGYVARIFATRGQMRMVAIRGAEAVASGRPLCRLCLLPMDPDGHDCPSRN